jgi:hypothetical protein
VGVIGVLDGLSVGTVNVLNAADGVVGESPLRTSLEKDLFESRLFTPAVALGTLNVVLSSNSSMEGKACANSERLKCANCGDEEGEDDGDGGPNVAGETKVCGEGAEETAVAGAKADNVAGGDCIP